MYFNEPQISFNSIMLAKGCYALTPSPPPLPAELPSPRFSGTFLYKITLCEKYQISGKEL